MKKFKKHKFISKERFARLFDMEEINIKLTPYEVSSENIVKTGFAQYAIRDVDSKSFELLGKKVARPDEEILSVAKGDLLGDILKLKQLNQYANYTKVKPIYKIINPYNKEPIDCNPYSMAGRYIVVLIGVLIK